jgi:predicted outer membrane repeat protein
MLIALATINPAIATDIAVTRFDDPTPTGCTASDCSLREAIILANTFVGADRILLPAGTYDLAIPGANETAAQTGDLDITDDLFILGDGSATTTVRWPLRFDRVFNIHDAEFTAPERQVTLSGLTIQGGGAPAAGGNLNGGGMLASGYNLSLKLVDVVFNDNFAMSGIGGGAYLSTSRLQIGAAKFTHNVSPRAGGAFIVGHGSLLKMTDVETSTNSAGRCGGMELVLASENADHVFDLRALSIHDNLADNDGGGLCAGSFNDGATIKSSSIQNNVAGNSGAGSGGGVLIEYATPDASLFGASLTLDGAYIHGNHAAEHGGGVLFGDDVATNINSCNLVLKNSEVSNNEALQGAGLFLKTQFSVCTTLISGGSVIAHNSASGSGGGIYFHDSGTFDLEDGSVTSNTSGSLGGGLYLQGGPASIRRSAILSNTSPSYGGAIEIYGPLHVDASTFDGNTSAHGGTLDNNGYPVTVNGSTLVGTSVASAEGTVYDNTGGSPAAPVFIDSILVGTCANDLPSAFVHDIESPGATCNLGESSRDDVSAEELALGPLADNGGPTLTHKPLEGSVAIGQLASFDCASVDQRGFIRPPPCDIGSTESDGFDEAIFGNGFEFD